MGWWKIKDVQTGEMDHDSELLETIPGHTHRTLVDHPDNFYIGDGPADHMDALLNSLCRKRDLSRDYLHSLILCGLIPDMNVRDLVDRMWEKVAREYLDEWRRGPCDEEKEALFNFCVNPLFEVEND